jgi:hypothetical protein
MGTLERLKVRSALSFSMSPAILMVVFPSLHTGEKEEQRRKLGFNLPGAGGSSGKRSLVSAFGQEEDEDDDKTDKKRTLVPIDYGEEAKGRGHGSLSGDGVSGYGLDSSLAAAAQFAKKVAQQPMDAKSLIDSIPKDKEGLFSFDLNWSVYDKVCGNHSIPFYRNHFFAF